MISKSQVKLIASLHQKKFRKEHNLFIAEGEKVCRDLLDSGWPVRSLYVTREFSDKKFFGGKSPVNVEIISEKEMAQISALTTPQPVLAVAEIHAARFSMSQLHTGMALMLDDIRDPGNLGTIFRIADWFGIHTVICSETCADAYNPKTVQATMGSLFRINIIYHPLASVLKNASEDKIPVYGTLLTGENIYQAELSDRGIIVIGSESHGISETLLPFISRKISIPSFSDSGYKKADSLNAAMAAAIVCSEFRRR